VRFSQFNTVMDAVNSQSPIALPLLLLLFVFLIVAGLGWCLISSCLGREAFQLWSLSGGRGRYRRVEDKMWEMPERRRGR